MTPKRRKGCEMEIKYFISYWIQNGHGRCDIINDKPISTIEDIASIEKAISAKAGEKVLIKSWQRFEDEEEKG